MSTRPSLFETGENCWRIERADKVAVIIDAADYFVALRAALKKARQAIHLIGWDFDLRIEMCPGESDDDGNAPDGWPNRLGDFLVELTRRNAELDLYVLKWDGAMLAAVGKQVLPTLWMQWLSGEQIHFQLDSHHPVGACHHSKIVVIDDQMAFCGGIDATVDRWDTRQHEPDNDRRTQPNGESYGPWHDATTALEGPVAKALGDLSRMRWKAANGEELEPVDTNGPSPWPDDLEPNFTDVDVAIARTAPAYHDEPLINEIEELYLSAIRAAEKSIYLESQYLASGSLCEALEERLREPDGPELLVINPRNAESFMEDEAMHSVRALMMERLEEAGGSDRFRIYHPVNAAEEPIYVHAKVLIVDDRILRVGSSNVDNRSMGFDTECDVAIDSSSAKVSKAIVDLRNDLMAEHLDSDAETVARTIAETGSLIATVDRLNAESGRGLRTIEAEALDPLEKMLAETQLLDPTHDARARDYIKHASKRALSPYQASAVTGLAVVGGLTAAAVLGWSLYRIAKRLREPKRDGFPAPAVITHRPEPHVHDGHE